MSDPVAAKPVWRTALEVEDQAPGRYPDHVNTPLLDLIDGTPVRVLELGCASGAFGQALKLRHPGASVVGIEASREAASIAESRMDLVIRSRLEDLDFAAAGFREGEFDTVVAADILEHLVNPWQLLEELGPWLAPRAQVVASIPNARNALLIAALAVNGRWEYRERGLLDITHLRFFTLEEIRRMFSDTGYAVEHYAGIPSPPLAEFYRANASREKVTMQLGKLILADLAPQEVFELCTEQLLIRARRA